MGGIFYDDDFPLLRPALVPPGGPEPIKVRVTLLDSSGRILGTSGQAALTALRDGVGLRPRSNAAWRIPRSPLRSSHVIRLADKGADIPDVRVPQDVIDVRPPLRGGLRDRSSFP